MLVQGLVRRAARSCWGRVRRADAAKLLRRVLKKHNRALVYRRTTVTANNQRCSIYKYRLI